jgi:gliding motility-associated-like protein
MIKKLVLLIYLLTSTLSFSLEALGGYISWRCNGTGRYIFELTLYRDCNTADISSNSEIIKVWNHPGVSEIAVNLNQRVNLSPICSQVQGSPVSLACGTGANAGNGLGAIEKLVYTSAEIDLDGKPSVEGWTLTFETESRRGSLSNLLNPAQYGMTLSSTIYESSPAQNNCIDNSPTLYNDFDFIVCNSQAFNFMQQTTDSDFDKLEFVFSSPLKNILSGSFEKGINPASVDYLNNFSPVLPLPGSSSSPANTNISIDASVGDIDLRTNTNGEYVVKFIVNSYRGGKINASMDVEYTLFVINCDNINQAPIVEGPFDGLFEYEAIAGELINFNLTSTDVQNLQDGSPQTNIVKAISPMYGQNFTNSSLGCLITPCATLGNGFLTPGVQGKTVQFSWQTSCNHLRSNYGLEFDSIAYDFVFKFQDDYCQIPKSTYKRIRIHLKTIVEIEPAKIDCIQVLQTGELMITRTDPPNPDGIPVQYELTCIQTGITEVMNTNTITIPSISIVHDYFIKTISGSPCSVAISSDTVRNIILELTPNPENSVAILSWNAPYSSSIDREGYYTIMREYPAGVWTEIAQLDYGINRFFDTVDVCNAFLSYVVIFNKIGCSFFSNIVGADLQDGHSPDLPEIYSVSIDPITNRVVVRWNVNPKKDTYGYIVYMRDENNFSVEIDTIYGRFNNSASFELNTSLDALTFTVAAFDSCYTDLGNFYSTTGKCPEHTTIFLTNTYVICDRTVNLSWTPYIGWNEVKEYEVLQRINGGNYSLVGVTSANSFSIPVQINRNYDFIVMARDISGFKEAYSNRSSRFSLAPIQPSFHYTKSVSVENDANEINHYIENSSGVKDIIIQRLDESNQFVDIVTIPVNNVNMKYVDVTAQPSIKNNQYQVIYVDSCGNFSDTSNISETIFLSSKTDHLNLVNFLSWNPYKGFKGSILYYEVYRGFEGNFSEFPIARVPANQLFFSDTISDLLNFNGMVCYYVKAFESMNVYQFQETSKSNVICPVFQPLIYIPNSFTPNDDEFNQFFKVELSLKDVEEFELIIMNRWGERVFVSNNQNFAWDGTNNFDNKSCPQGTYLYLLKVKNGENQEISRKGFVNLIR